MKEVLIDSIFNFTIYKNGFEENHFHQEVELIYVLEGNMVLFIEDEKFILKRDDIVVINTNQKHNFKIEKDTVIAMFNFSYDHLSMFLKKNLILFWCNSSIDKDDSYNDLRKVIKEILNGYLRTDGEKDLLQYSLIYKLLSILGNGFLVDSNDKRFHVSKDKYEDRINAIAAYVRSNYNKAISLTDLADYLFLSSAYLSRFFKKELGTNFVEYVNDIRLHYALNDLLYTDKSMTRIALDNGFTSSAIFNKVFKDTYKLAPLAYRKKMKSKDNSENTKITVLNNEEMKEFLSSYFNENYFEENNILERANKYIIVDSNKKVNIKKHWNKIINIGNASDILRSDIQNHIVILKKQLGFEYVRLWSLFDEDMHIDIVNENENFNFNKIDRVLDFLVNNNMKPFIEFSNKGKRIHKNIDKDIDVKNNKSNFTSMKQLIKVVENFISHILNRYGYEEVEKWYFEIMKVEAYSGINDYCNIKDYGIIFEGIYKTIKKFVPDLKVGGAGFNINYNKSSLIEVMEAWNKSDVKPDFISAYVYPYVRDNEHFKRSTDKSLVLNKIRELKEISNQYLDVEEFIISEWNHTISNRNFINDSCYKGAYIVKSIIDSVDEMEMIGYWLGSDLFSESYDTQALLSGGVGLLTKDSIMKPAFYGIEFMNILSNNLIEKGANHIITSRSNNSYQIVCHNYKHPNYYYYCCKNEDSIKISEQYKIFDDNNVIKLNFQIRNVKNGEYIMKKYSLNRNNGSILDEWNKINFTNTIDKEDINYLKEISKPRLIIENYNVEDGILNFEVTLLPHEIDRIEIKYKM